MVFKVRADAIVEPADYARPRVEGVAFWHLLIAGAMREAQAARALSLIGVSAYVPLRATVKRVRRGRIHLRHVPVNQAAFRGYVFAGFRAGPDWLAIFETRLVRAVVAVAEKPYLIATREVLKIAERQAAGEFDDAAKGRARPARRKAAELEVGDRLRVIEDGHVLWGREYAAQTVEDGRVGVLHQWFGQSDFVEIPLDAVRKVA